ncbi:MAG: hypothetical protein IPI23_14940 [Bacteroidetes bacterium]|nr:hypothetical protein [Bacteroidota bacterium]
MNHSIKSENKFHQRGEAVLVFLIIAISFRTFSTLFYPALNSDQAIIILMGHSFQLPHDWYFWGQDRMGSLIPMLSYPFIKYFHADAILTESLVHYLILTAGYFAMASFINKPVYRLALAIFWFLPPFRMADLLLLSFGIQYSIIAILCFYSLKINRHEGELSIQQVLKWYLPLGITAIIGVWVSDLILISVILLVFSMLFFKKEAIATSLLKHRKGLALILFLTVTGFFFIRYVKSTGLRNDYSELGSFSNVIESLSIFVNSTYQILIFKGNEPFTSMYSYLIIILIFYFIYSVKKSLPGDTFLKRFFILDFLVIFMAIISTKWTLDNGVPRRYFVCTYISAGMAILLYLDSTTFRFKKYFNIFLITTLLIGGLGTIYNLRYIWPGTLKPRVEELKELKQLGKAGIIGDYWNSYVCAIVAPDSIIATPHQASQVRNLLLPEQVLNQPNIYLVQDWWLETFPDTVTQFQTILIKQGKPFSMGGLTLQKYYKK